MNLKVCRDCKNYMIDDGQEVICRFRDAITYVKIRSDSCGHILCNCPLESEFEKISGLNSYH